MRAEASDPAPLGLRGTALTIPTGEISLPRLFSLRGRTAVVTGAGSGLGREFSFVLAEAGADVVAADLSMETARETARLVQEAGGSASAAEVDVADPRSVEALAATARDQHRFVHILVNNAGISTPSRRVHEIPVDEWDRVLAVNLRGAFLCSRAILPLMLTAGTGSVINIASIVGLQALDPAIIAQAGYAASKAGLIGLTMQMAVEYAADGIRVNAIAPGWHLGTNLGRSVGNFPGPEDQARLAAMLRERTPMRRTGEPSELRGLLLYLASDASSFVTGQVISHDGGWTAW